MTPGGVILARTRKGVCDVLLSSTLSTFESAGKINVRIGKRTPGAALPGDDTEPEDLDEDEDDVPMEDEEDAITIVDDDTVLVPGGDAKGPSPVLAFGLSAGGFRRSISLECCCCC